MRRRPAQNALCVCVRYYPAGTVCQAFRATVRFNFLLVDGHSVCSWLVWLSNTHTHIHPHLAEIYVCVRVGLGWV